MFDTNQGLGMLAAMAAWAAASSEDGLKAEKAGKCHKCRERAGIKTDSNGRLVCGRCAAGTPPPARVGPKVGRNDPCPCNSGKKFKRCCLGKPPAEQAPEGGT